jgi:hypothetical protein
MRRYYIAAAVPTCFHTFASVIRGKERSQSLEEVFSETLWTSFHWSLFLIDFLWSQPAWPTTPPLPFLIQNRVLRCRGTPLATRGDALFSAEWSRPRARRQLRQLSISAYRCVSRQHDHFHAFNSTQRWSALSKQIVTNVLTRNVDHIRNYTYYIDNRYLPWLEW